MAKKAPKTRKPQKHKAEGLVIAKKRQDRRLKRQGKTSQTSMAPGFKQGVSSKFKRKLVIMRANRLLKKKTAEAGRNKSSLSI
jgi:hypothetical protein